MKRLILVVLILSLTGCFAGKNPPQQICDRTQQVYAIANGAAVAAKEAGVFTNQQWNDCVVPLDNIANAGVVACYRLALAGGTFDQVVAAANAAMIMVLNFQQLSCKGQ